MGCMLRHPLHGKHVIAMLKDDRRDLLQDVMGISVRSVLLFFNRTGVAGNAGT